MIYISSTRLGKTVALHDFEIDSGGCQFSARQVGSVCSQEQLEIIMVPLTPRFFVSDHRVQMQPTRMSGGDIKPIGIGIKLFSTVLNILVPSTSSRKIILKCHCSRVPVIFLNRHTASWTIYRLGNSDALPCR